ncbi:MAG: hypothetical protein VB032_03305 [Burkholderiaceae bacterium]|nr:hypothetical protein [Burkholderiaceae bacterium]
MGNEVVSFVVIGCLVVTALLAFYTLRKKRAEQRAAQDTPSNVESWMRTQAYAPDHFHFFYATAIGFKDGDDRILLYRNRKPAFHLLSDIAAIATHESIERSRPLGAAPGVVELKSIRRFNLDISLKNSGSPFRILFEQQPLMAEWEARLKALLDHQ